MTIGDRITKMRLDKSYSQRKLAQLSGITNTAVSAIENDKVSPSISTLEAILKVLDSSLSEFFSAHEEILESNVVVHAEQLINIGNEEVAFYLVHNNNPNRRLGFMIEKYAPHSSTEKKITHEGEEAGTVIEGGITLLLGGQSYYLKAGDSYVIDTAIPHTFLNEGKVLAKIISAHTPATY